MLEVTSPYDGRLIKRLPLSSLQDAEAMLAKANELFSDREQWLQPHQRIDVLNRLAELVSKDAGKFASLIAQEGGKPLIDAKVEVARGVDGIYLAVKELSRMIRGEEIPMGLTPATEGRRAFTQYEPIGVVLALSAFNHPLNLIIHQAIPAVAVGCPVIVKPAAATPLNCLALCDLLIQAGLPAGWCQPVIQPGEVDRIHEWVTEAVDGGAELLCGGKKLADSLCAPTVLLNPPDDARVSTQEIFGPVICLYSYTDKADAIARANSLDVAFQAAVFSKDLDTCLDTANRLDASAVMINDHTAFRADWMPFAGRRHSGYGIGGIGYTMQDMVQLKMIVIKS